MTPTRRKHLEWIRKHEPVGLFPCDGSAPSPRHVKRLVKEGDVEEAGREAGRGFFALALYRLTDQGRSRLADVAEALSREKYGKPRCKVPADLSPPDDLAPQASNRQHGCARPGAGGVEVGSEPGSPRSQGRGGRP